MPCVQGTCYTPDDGEHYTCTCSPGWTSEDCDIVDCSNSAIHCQNGGTCNSVAGGTSYTCTCGTGWTGDDCGTVDCSVYCQNGGTCNHINGGSSHQCSCTNGWTGDNCETVDCSVHCQNGGKCNHINGGESHQCSCAPGWSGDDCQYVDCSDSEIHCRNGGQCNLVSGGVSFTCACTVGWMGNICQTVDCSVYCQNGGTCNHINGGASHQCTCAEGWMGDDCQYIDCSSSIYCLNGGTCIPINGGYEKTCDCAYGWTGSNCEEIDICTPYENADIVFAIDASISQGESSDFEQRRSYVKNFISKFPIGPLDYRFQFSVLTYSFEATVHFYLNEYQNMTDLLAAVDGIATGQPGVTYTGAMLKTVREEIFNLSNGARNSVERYLVVLTDGLSSDLLDTTTQAEYLRSMGVKTYAVGTGSSVSHKELIDIATYYGHVFTMVTPDALHSLLHKSMFGCEDCAKQTTDVALLMDVSSSTSPKQLDTLVKAVTHVVKYSDLSDVQFSFTTFSNQYISVYKLNQHTDAADHIFHINTYTLADSVDASTLSDALTYISTDAFLPTNGGRSESRKIAIVLTAGNFTDNADDIQTKAQNLKDNGVIVVAVGISRYTNMTNLMTVASDPSLIYVLGEDVFTDVDVLDSLKSLLEYSDCSQFS